MLKRSSPRSRSARVIANGNDVSQLAVDLARVQQLVLVEDRPLASCAARCRPPAAARSCRSAGTRSPRTDRSAARRACPGGRQTENADEVRSKKSEVRSVVRRFAPVFSKARLAIVRAFLTSDFRLLTSNFRLVLNCHHLPRVEARRGTAAWRSRRTSGRSPRWRGRTCPGWPGGTARALNTGWYGCGRPFSTIIEMHRRERGEQDRRLERRRDERRPTSGTAGRRCSSETR